MIKADFDEAKLFIFADIEREIQLAKLDRDELQRMGINPGGGNFLAALGLLCYTEFAGKLRSRTNNASQNFNDCFDRLGPAYASFRMRHNVYDLFRCGLAHEYYVKRSCLIEMTDKNDGRSGISENAVGGYYFVVETYCRDLKKVFDDLETELYGRPGS